VELRFAQRHFAQPVRWNAQFYVMLLRHHT